MKTIKTINTFQFIDNISFNNLSLYDYSTDLSCSMHEVEEWNNTKTVSNMYPGHKDIICSANIKFIFRLIHSYQHYRNMAGIKRHVYHAYCNSIHNTTVLNHKRSIKDYVSEE